MAFILHSTSLAGKQLASLSYGVLAVDAVIGLIDEKFSDILEDLREARLQVARDQLHNIEDTVDELISRKIGKKSQRNKLIRAVSSALVEKILFLENRGRSENAVYHDELALYLEMIPEVDGN